MNRKAFALVAGVLIALNFAVLVAAYPSIPTVNSGCCDPGHLLAKDFSAYYIGAWRLLHDPAQVYTHGLLGDGEYWVLPQPQSYKYLPSFLLFVAPLVALPYLSALTAFDILQFLLLPAMAFLVYELTKGKSTLATLAVSVAALLLPLPLPGPNWSLSLSYYWQWAEGQSKVLATFLLLFALYLGKRGHPKLSGLVFGVAAFDPRFALLAAPIFLVSSSKPKVSAAYAFGAFALANFPLLYPPLGEGFIQMVLSSGISTPLYYYAYIPVVTIVLLSMLNGREIASAARRSVLRLRLHLVLHRPADDPRWGSQA